MLSYNLINAKNQINDSKFKCDLALLNISNINNHCEPSLFAKFPYVGINLRSKLLHLYRAFHGIGKAYRVYYMVILVLGSSQFSLLPQMSLKMTLNLKVVKIDSKIIIANRS